MRKFEKHVKSVVNEVALTEEDSFLVTGNLKHYPVDPTCSDSCADGGDTRGVELIATIRKYRMVGNYSKNPNSSMVSKGGVQNVPLLKW